MTEQREKAMFNAATPGRRQREARIEHKVYHEDGKFPRKASYMQIQEERVNSPKEKVACVCRPLEIENRLHGHISKQLFS